MMPGSLILACLWTVLACLAAMGPRNIQWPAAWALIAAGIPLLGWATYQVGPFWGIVLLVAGAAVVRWPLRRAAHHLYRTVGGSENRMDVPK